MFNQSGQNVGSQVNIGGGYKRAMLELIFDAIQRERSHQKDKWGDKSHTVGNFILIMEGELEEAKEAWRKGIGDKDALRELLQVVAVGVACFEQHGVAERDGQPVDM